MKDFESRYKKLINKIKGNKENQIVYETGEDWSIEAVNPATPYVSLGEVRGEILVFGTTLEEVLTKFEIAIEEFNKGRK